MSGIESGFEFASGLKPGIERLAFSTSCRRNFKGWLAALSRGGLKLDLNHRRQNVVALGAGYLDCLVLLLHGFLWFNFLVSRG
jgi:hypothetical protein